MKPDVATIRNLGREILGETPKTWFYHGSPRQIDSGDFLISDVRGEVYFGKTPDDVKSFAGPRGYVYVVYPLGKFVTYQNGAHMRSSEPVVVLTGWRVNL